MWFFLQLRKSFVSPRVGGPCTKVNSRPKTERRCVVLDQPQHGDPKQRCCGWAATQPRSVSLWREGSLSVVLLLAVGLFATFSFAQDRLKTMPGYERFERVSRES